MVPGNLPSKLESLSIGQTYIRTWPYSEPGLTVKSQKTHALVVVYSIYGSRHPTQVSLGLCPSGQTYIETYIETHIRTVTFQVCRCQFSRTPWPNTYPGATLNRRRPETSGIRSRSVTRSVYPRSPASSTICPLLQQHLLVARRQL